MVKDFPVIKVCIGAEMPMAAQLNSFYCEIDGRQNCPKDVLKYPACSSLIASYSCIRAGRYLLIAS